MIQTAIATILMFVLMFGIGFIINMLLKTTWLPLYMYILLVIGLLIWFGVKEPEPFLTTISEFGIPDYAMGIGGLLGAWLTGSTIKMLRIKGYKMF